MAPVYKVGQVLYVVPEGKTTVFPLIVVEEITKKTLSGEVRSYILQGGADGKTRVSLEELKGEVFDSSERVKATLIDRVTNHINKKVANAVTMANQ